MSLNRWSLPTRALIRDKSTEEDVDDPPRFSTIHIGQPAPHGRANLSSAFASLFEKSENRRGLPSSQDDSSGGGSLAPLAPRRENVLPEANLKSSHAQESPAIEIVTTSLGQSSKIESESEKNVIRGDGTRELMQGVFGQVLHHITETPKIRSFSLSSTETDVVEQRDGHYPLRRSKSTEDLDRVRSNSSSYPSEGMRSPVGESRSPEPTTYTKSFIAEFYHCGAYPSQSSHRLSNIPGSEISVGNATATTSDTVSSLAMSGGNGDLQIPATKVEIQEHEGPIRTNVSVPQLRGRYRVQSLGQDRQPSSNTEMTVPILENESSGSSQLQVSFMTYKRPSPLSMSEGHAQLDSSHTESISLLRPSTDTTETILTVARRSSLSDEDAWPKTYARDRPRSRPASWRQLFNMPVSNGSTVTLGQRIQRFELRKWVKKVCFKTKARFEPSVEPVPITKTKTKPTGSHALRRGWRRMRRDEKSSAKLKKSSKKSSKKVHKVAKKQKKEHKTTAYRLLGSLTKRASLQLGMFMSEKDGEHGSHRRERSCPAEMKL